MKFIHAVIFDKDEFENGNYNSNDWDELTNGDYIVHCLYNAENENIIILNDNCHQPVEIMIDRFLDGVRYASSVNVGGLIIDNSDVEVIKALVIVNNGCSYQPVAIKEKLVNGDYKEVI